MKVSYSLIKQFLDINISANDVAAHLTLAGLEVDSIEYQTSPFSGVFVGLVKETKKHPEADKLCIATVTDGKEDFQVVCGAINCRKDIKVAFAKVNATLEDENKKQFKIKKAKLRGIESHGMLCSEKELSISNMHEKIIEFDESFEIGQDLEHLSSPIFEISLTPNLGHCMSAIGIARELAAILNKKIKHPNTNVEEISKHIKDSISIIREDKEGCPRYCCRIIEDLSIPEESPLWLKKELFASNIRPISPIVDITNYVMIELGQPLHAFDLDLIDNKKITIKSTKTKEHVLCLDKEKRTIPENTLVIADDKKILAIAGVMGADNSAISSSTKSIVLESAFFNSAKVRKTSRSINLKTESSQRFEKGIDPNMVNVALDRATSLIQKICKGKVQKGIIDSKDFSFERKTLKLRPSKANDLLGTNLSNQEIISIFERLDSTINIKNDDFLITVPTYRNDLNIETDLIEEVARVYGYNNIPKIAPKYSSENIPHSPLYLFENYLKKFFIAEKIQEIQTCDIVSEKLATLTTELSLPTSSIIKVLHSKSVDHSYLRPSLLSNLLEVVRFNNQHKNQDLRLFEVGRIYQKKNEGFLERSALGIILTGNNEPYNLEKSRRKIDFFDLKGILENLFNSLQIESSFSLSAHPIFHPGQQANIFIDNIDIGVIGAIHPNILNTWDLSQNVYFAELNINELMKHTHKRTLISPIPQFPSSERDWTIITKENVPVQTFFEIFNKISNDILEKVFLLDIYKDQKIDNQKNVTFRFIYRDKTKTLSFEEVEKSHNKLMQETKKILQDYLIT
jgi:phenylalanyl-tRNA synthetase beta chain